MAIRHAISLLVHEQVDVIVDQCLNFECFAPAALIMIHVSPSATFLRDTLVEALRRAGCGRSLVNPQSVRSAWGALSEAHLSNIRALEAHCDQDTIVSFHASNDMLLRTLPDFPPGRTALFNEFEVSPHSTWYTGRKFGQSAAFAALLDQLGCERACGSQIEGASYPYGLLRELAGKLDGKGDLLAALPDASEEIIFSTWARCHLGKPSRIPYVLFRSSRLLEAGAAVLPRPLRATGVTDIVQKAINRLEVRFASPLARAADVESLILGRPASGAQGRSAAGPVHYGIKRVARVYDDPLRRRIRAHTLAQSAPA